MTHDHPLCVLYDGALEPLGESQVGAYLELLSRRHTITLLSFEKRSDLAESVGDIKAPSRKLPHAR